MTQPAADGTVKALFEFTLKNLPVILSKMASHFKLLYIDIKFGKFISI